MYSLIGDPGAFGLEGSEPFALLPLGERRRSAQDFLGPLGTAAVGVGEEGSGAAGTASDSSSVVVVVVGESGVRIGDECDDDAAVAVVETVARSRAGVEGVARLAYDNGAEVEGVVGSAAGDAVACGGVAGFAEVSSEGGGGVADGTMGGGAAGGWLGGFGLAFSGSVAAFSGDAVGGGPFVRGEGESAGAAAGFVQPGGGRAFGPSDNASASAGGGGRCFLLRGRRGGRSMVVLRKEGSVGKVGSKCARSDGCDCGPFGTGK